jgi:PAS domain-containing protein
VSEGARELCQAHGAAVALREPEGERVVYRHGTGAPPEGPPLELAAGLAAEVLRTGRPARLAGIPADPGLAGDDLAPVGAPGIQAAAAVPITVDGRVEGLLCVHRQAPRPFTPRDEAILARLAEHAAIAIRNAALFARVQAARGAAETSEQRFRDLVQGLDAIVWEVDARTLRFTFVSQQAEVILGYPVEHWLAEPEFRLRHVHPEDRAAVAAAWEAAVTEARPAQVEYRARGVGSGGSGRPSASSLVPTAGPSGSGASCWT